MNNKGLNTKQVGNLFGVDESTVRRWALAGKINCTSSAGGHRSFSYKNIIEFSRIKGVKIKSKSDSSSINEKKITNEIITLILNHDSKTIESILIKLYINGISLSNIMDNYIEKTLVEIQKKLELKEISIAEEHIARKIISKSLNSFRLSISNEKTKKLKNILCLNLENDIPDLPIDMIQILLEDINYNVDNCGSHTCIKDLKKLLKNKNYEAIFIYLCNRQCCTSTVVDNIQKTNQNLREISKLAKKYKIKIFLGGPSFKNINKEVLKTYNQFTKYSESLSINKNLNIN